MIGSGNPAEGELRPQLLDRFGLSGGWRRRAGGLCRALQGWIGAAGTRGGGAVNVTQHASSPHPWPHPCDSPSLSNAACLACLTRVLRSERGDVA